MSTQCNSIPALRRRSPGAPPALSPSVAAVLACGCSGTWGPAGLPLCQLGSPCDFSLRGPGRPALSCSSDGLLRPWATPVLRRSLVRLLLMSGALALWRSAPQCSACRGYLCLVETGPFHARPTPALDSAASGAWPLRQSVTPALGHCSAWPASPVSSSPPDHVLGCSSV